MNSIDLCLFTGDNVDCWMEIQNGKGPWASPISGIVPLGSTLTMVVAINDLAGTLIIPFLLPISFANFVSHSNGRNNT